MQKRHTNSPFHSVPGSVQGSVHVLEFQCCTFWQHISKLQDKLNDYEITIVLGTWCSDSKVQVPHFYRVINDAGYNDKRVKVIAVDKMKEAVLVDISMMNIERVPTFIIYKDDKEVGRIIETPKKTLERDLWKIIK